MSEFTAGDTVIVDDHFIGVVEGIPTPPEPTGNALYDIVNLSTHNMLNHYLKVRFRADDLHGAFSVPDNVEFMVIPVPIERCVKAE